MSYSLLLFVALLALTQSIFIVNNQPSWKKCYYTQHSPDKTLEARLGFLRREKAPCMALFTVKIVEQGETLLQIYSKQHSCQQARPNEAYVLKHTSGQSVSQGMYEICVEMIYNQNQNTIIQVYMGERLNPIIYQHSQSPLPLIQSQQLIDLDLTAQSIKRSLVKSRQHYKASREKGQAIDTKIIVMMDLNQFSNIAQIISLVVFGIVWVRIASRLKKNK